MDSHLSGLSWVRTQLAAAVTSGESLAAIVTIASEWVAANTAREHELESLLSIE